MKTINMNKYIFTIKSKIIVDGDTNLTELTTVGKYSRVNNKWVMMYDEIIDDTSTSVCTVIRVTDDAVSITRNGDESSRIIIQLDKRNMCHYRTDYGELMMGVYCSDIKNELDQTGGEIKMIYTLDVNASVFSKNEVTIKVREVKPNV